MTTTKESHQRLYSLEWFLCTLLGAPGLTTRSDRTLLGAPGLTTSNNKATRSKGIATSNKGHYY